MSFPVSDHCNGKTFFYPGGPVTRGAMEVLRWKLTSYPARWPRKVKLAPQPPPPTPGPKEVVATWIGHSTFLLKTPQGNFLTDPIFSKRCGPGRWAGPRRAHPPGLDFKDLPKIDGVLLSHDHYDHLDFRTLKKLSQTHNPLVIAPLGHRDLLAQAGLGRVVELDWWQNYSWGGGLTITLTPARHWSRRTLGGTNSRLWGGFYLKSGEKKVYFVGDSGYDSVLFTRIKYRMSSPDLALIPIGSYAPQWFMQSSHLNPAEAVRVHVDLGSQQSVGMHWGTFQLTDEAREEPPQLLAEICETSQIAGDAFRVLAPGESLVIQ